MLAVDVAAKYGEASLATRYNVAAVCGVNVPLKPLALKTGIDDVRRRRRAVCGQRADVASSGACPPAAAMPSNRSATGTAVATHAMRTSNAVAPEPPVSSIESDDDEAAGAREENDRTVVERHDVFPENGDV